jgi:hypothetical protein
MTVHTSTALCWSCLGACGPPEGLQTTPRSTSSLWGIGLQDFRTTVPHQNRTLAVFCSPRTLVACDAQGCNGGCFWQHCKLPFHCTAQANIHGTADAGLRCCCGAALWLSSWMLL